MITQRITSYRKGQIKRYNEKKAARNIARQRKLHKLADLLGLSDKDARACLRWSFGIKSDKRGTETARWKLIRIKDFPSRYKKADIPEGTFGDKMAFIAQYWADNS
jgi:hypothetical protein